ncbi:ectoine hydroxylase [Streptomyces odonnellii]|uniref:ectoine hydroxylase n=1 Tax=Streptomyces odonnellii TaxID=1417980 RepID=UPI00062679E4|nr:ectoine hydroxylase [Streptomyces odonnellii]
MTTTPVRTENTERTDLYPTRGPREVITPRQDPVVWSAPGDAGPVSPADLRGLERDGFLTVDELIGPDEVALYRAELDRLISDPKLRADERSVIEPKSQDVRSVFEVHRISELFAGLVRDERVAGRARQILGSEVYVHQSRINVKPGFGASGFYWHSDFETWHAEDGLPRMRTVSVSIALTENYDTNGGLMIMPGSHRSFLGCAGETPRDNYKRSLKMQDAGTPSHGALTRMADRHGIRLFTGRAGSATWFDCNCMHGSGDNITPYPRSNVFIVFNSVENAAVEPFAAPSPRPEFIGARDFTPVR